MLSWVCRVVAAGAFIVAALAGDSVPRVDLTKSHFLPGYPEKARQEGKTGTVVLAVHVNEIGKPFAVEVEKSSGSPDIDQSAVFAVRYWRFVPAERDGETTAEWTAVAFRFDGDGVTQIETDPETAISRADRNKPVCKRQPPKTGSIIDDKPVCMAKWQWDEQARRLNTKRWNTPTPPAMGGAGSTSR